MISRTRRADKDDVFCRRCNHKLLGLTKRCPGCGRPYDADRPRTYRDTPRAKPGVVSRMLSIIAALTVIGGYALAALGGVGYLSTSPREGWALAIVLIGGFMAMSGGVPLAVLVPFRWRVLNRLGRSAFVLITVLGLGLLPAAYGLAYALA